jgi:hypothetical protein
MSDLHEISLRTAVSLAGMRLVEIASSIGGMTIYAHRPEYELIGTHALRELRELHTEIGIALARFEADHPDEVRRSRRINDYRATHPAPEASP